MKWFIPIPEWPKVIALDKPILGAHERDYGKIYPYQEDGLCSFCHSLIESPDGKDQIEFEYNKQRYVVHLDCWTAIEVSQKLLN